MIDIILEKYSGKIEVYEIRNGNKVKVETINDTYCLEDGIDYVNENYDYARILCGRNIY